MERESNPPIQSLCRSGCGFYGSLSTDGFCSVCYKEELKKKQQSSADASNTVNAESTTSVALVVDKSDNLAKSSSVDLPAEASTSSTSVADSTPGLASSEKTADGQKVNNEVKINLNQEKKETAVPADKAATTDGDDKDSKTKKKNRCAICKKKLGLTGFECRCGGLYCGVHRYSDKHACTFNYRELGAREIRKNNPVVVEGKIQKI